MVDLWDYRQVWWDMQRPEGWRRYYKIWSIPKNSGGRRWIQAPQGQLKELQRLLVSWLNQWPLHPAARAYLPGGASHVEVAKEHLQHAGPTGSLVTADIKDFFGHVTAELLRKAGLPQEIVLLITIPHPYRGRVLPQGAPTSPPASNIAMRDFDQALSEALPPGTLYTRWADDLGISAPYRLDGREIKRLLQDLLRQYGFYLAKDKFRLMTPESGRVYLGISLREKELQVPRRYRRKLRSKQHHFAQGDTTEASLKGMVDYVERVRSL